MRTEDPGRRAAERATSSGRRTRELSERLTRPSAGQLPDAGSVERARGHAETAAEHARESLERTRLGHERAARAHDRTAALHETAVRAGVGDAEEHRDRAAGHRLAADRDRRAAAEDAGQQPEGGHLDEPR